MKNNFLGGLRFNPSKNKKHNKKVSDKINKKLYCVCRQEGDDFKAYVNIPSDLEFPDTLVVPFTDKSYELKGKTIIFSKKPDKHKKYTKIYRDKYRAVTFPGSPDLYTPFRNNYVYSGYLIKTEGSYKFDVCDMIDKYSEVSYLVPNVKMNVNEE